jgi:hypothetical protein
MMLIAKHSLACLHHFHLQLLGLLPSPLVPVRPRQVGDAGQHIKMFFTKRSLACLHYLHVQLFGSLVLTISAHDSTSPHSRYSGYAIEHTVRVEAVAFVYFCSAFESGVVKRFCSILSAVSGASPRSTVTFCRASASAVMVFVIVKMTEHSLKCGRNSARRLVYNEPLGLTLVSSTLSCRRRL